MQIVDLYVDSLKAQETKSKYQYQWDRFERHLPGWKKLKDPTAVTESVISYLVSMKKEGLSFSYRSVALAALKHYYSMADLLLNWKKISKFLGEDEDRDSSEGYSREDIAKMLTFADVKYRAIILCYASSGMRRAALTKLKISDFTYLQKYGLYKIKIYKNSRSSQICFCSPESADAIKLYIKNKKPNEYFHDVQPKAVSAHLRDIAIRAGIAEHHNLGQTEGQGRYRAEVPPTHGLRKFCTNMMKKAKVDTEIRKILTGHSIGVEKSYIQPAEDELLAEYSKAIPFLTISKEAQLSTELKDLAIKNEGFVSSVDSRLRQKDEEIELLKNQITEMQTISETEDEEIKALRAEFYVLRDALKKKIEGQEIDKAVKGVAKNFIKKEARRR